MNPSRRLFLQGGAGLAAAAAWPASASWAQFNLFGASDAERRMQAYREARAAFDQDAGAYWSAVSDKRRGRYAKRREGAAVLLADYVLEQPPVYTGPKRPPQPEQPPGPERPRKYIPVMADFLGAARKQYQFAPRRPSAEIEFKRAYVRTALAEGLTLEQIVRVYSFETGGNGTHDVQSGLTSNRPGARAISTAVGYNQLLTTNSVELMAEKGDHFLKVLSARARSLQGQQRRAMDEKITVLRRMIAFSRTVPDQWSEHEKLANTERGWGVHAMVVDLDVGPLLQTHKLLTSVEFARRKGHERPLAASDLEMMNLTGDGTGLDMVMMPGSFREEVPTSNFFVRAGYERNPVAIRNNTVAKLFAVMDARMDSNSQKPGARELASAGQA